MLMPYLGVLKAAGTQEGAMVQLQPELSETSFSKIVSLAWSDPNFKAKLLSDPAAACAEVGVPLPPNLTIKVVEDTDTVMHVVLPPAPPGPDFTDQTIEKATAANLYSSGNSHCNSYSASIVPVLMTCCNSHCCVE